ncbi:ATP-binding protein [Candidatus Poriferisodalis sp.]|uniref:ATP-binding protein n=1 Tax=Candidatus Poriferisodalis sp. TaxID=3101277 RepID=UPI003B01E7B6
MPNQTDQCGAFVARHAEPLVRAALADTRIVAIVGPRQSGKTTLARRIADDDGRQFVTLDDEQSRRFAQDDPAGFTRGLNRVVIDEIQRAPNLILALKRIVDEDPRPGRFLITGSVDLFAGSLSPDSLAGRVETVELLPFSQAETAGTGPSSFIDRAFACDFAGLDIAGPTDDLVGRVVGGGFPEALSRTASARRQSWLRNYARMVAEHDVRDIAQVSKHGELPRLIDHAAVAAGGLANMSALGTRLGVDGKTVDRWLVLLERMFLIRRVRAWHRSGLKRLVKAPKLQFLDSGLLAALQGVDAASIADDRQRLGPLLESFVYGELAKTAALSSDMTTVSHYRDKSGAEVDFVLERSPGAIVGIEVKSRATAHPRDFTGLRRLRDAAGDSFACGILLHNGDRIQQAAPGLHAMPVKTLWEA